MPWYSAKTVYQYSRPLRIARRERYLYGERIVLFEADDFEHCIAQAESDGKAHASRHQCEFLEDFVSACRLGDEPGDYAEVFSLMRKSALDAETYFDRFFNVDACLNPPDRNCRPADCTA